MKSNSSLLIKLLVVQCLVVLCVAKHHHHNHDGDEQKGSGHDHEQQKDFDFFYFVQQWPESYCDTRQGCCYPKTGKPAEDFSIHGLWPNYNDGTYPSNCDHGNVFDDSQISDLESRLEKEWPTLACPSGDGMKFWGHEWNKHGTCAESVLNQHSYFEKALDLKKKANLLQVLKSAGIRPDGNFYSLESIKEAIEKALGTTPFIDCNVDTSGNHRIYQVYLCVDSSASDFIKCPVMPHGRPCGSKIEFPPFPDSTSQDDSTSTDHEEL